MSPESNPQTHQTATKSSRPCFLNDLQPSAQAFALQAPPNPPEAWQFWNHHKHCNPLAHLFVNMLSSMQRWSKNTRSGSRGQRANIPDLDSMQTHKRNTKGLSGWRATRCPSHRRPGSGLGTGVEVGGRNQAREHDLVKSAPVPFRV